MDDGRASSRVIADGSPPCTPETSGGVNGRIPILARSFSLARSGAMTLPDIGGGRARRLGLQPAGSIALLQPRADQDIHEVAIRF